MRPRQKLVSVLLFSTACTIDEAPDQMMETAPEELIALRSELVETPAAEALARMDYFRPICDEAGYPLVGNLANKGPAAGTLQPSAFCTEVRAKLQ